MLSPIDSTTPPRGADAIDLVVALRMVLSMEGNACRPK
jgi:hypothetical protein